MIVLRLWHHFWTALNVFLTFLISDSTNTESPAVDSSASKNIRSKQKPNSLWLEDDYKCLKKNVTELERDNLKITIEGSSDRAKLLKLDISHRRAQIRATRAQAKASDAQAHFFRVAARAIENQGIGAVQALWEQATTHTDEVMGHLLFGIWTITNNIFGLSINGVTQI